MTQTPTDPFDPFWNPGSRWFVTLPDGRLCSYSKSALGTQSPLVCELPYVPRSDAVPTPIHPVAPIPTTEPPFVPEPPVPVVTPEPSTVAMFALGVMALAAAKRWRK